MIYLDNAATTFKKPPQVIRSMLMCMREYCGNPGRSSHPAALRAAEAVYDTRLAVAGLFGIEKAENVIFTQNATQALNIAIGGLLRKDDHVITTNMEHNSVLRTVVNLCAQLPASYDTVNALASDDELLRELESKINRKTKMIVTIHSSNVCSRVLPAERIGQLCKKYGIYYILDASQSAGIQDINIKRDGVTALCAPGHKALMGPMGTGICVFCDGFDFKALIPRYFGGNGLNSSERDMGRTSPESYEAGTVNVPGIVGLCEGIKYIKATGTDVIRAHEAFLFSQAEKYLSEYGDITVYVPEYKGSVLLFNKKDISGSELSSRLGEMGICTRPGLHCAPSAHAAIGTGGDAVRASFSIFTTAEDVYRFCRSVEKAAGYAE